MQGRRCMSGTDKRLNVSVISHPTKGLENFRLPKFCRVSKKINNSIRLRSDIAFLYMPFSNMRICTFVLFSSNRS